jgi:hypothetical protein
LYFCRDSTLRLFYRLLIISAQLYISPPEIVPPLIVPFTLTPSVSCVSKYPYYGLSLSSRIPWPVFFLKGRWSLNAPALIISLHPRDSFPPCFPVGLISTVSLASFSCLNYLSITWAFVPRIRVQGVDRSMFITVLFFSLVIRPLSAISPPRRFWCIYARVRSYFYYIVRPYFKVDSFNPPSLIPFLPSGFLLLFCKFPARFPPLIDRRNGPCVFDYLTYFR